MQHPETELILHPTQGVYHLHLMPEELANIVITVGDPDRVPLVSKYFDRIEVRKQHREFVTHTGWFQGKRISVVSTGIGPDNIDIVLNELDALVNIDFTNKTNIKDRKSLNIIRIGTSGSLQPHIPVDSFVVGKHALGLDNMMAFYDQNKAYDDPMAQALRTSQLLPNAVVPYGVSPSKQLLKLWDPHTCILANTLTSVGFYGPQGRVLGTWSAQKKLMDGLVSFNFNGQTIDHIEMETSAIYGLSSVFGHQAVSLNAILANRSHQTFSKHPEKTINKLIEWALEHLSQV
ncbi:MAG TPA: phosphorylase [Flavobacteriaceae bacterium]|jgi:uridine phosphorylase|nr:phosphorylase [Flavobacteriaceae bacterium]